MIQLRKYENDHAKIAEDNFRSIRLTRRRQGSRIESKAVVLKTTVASGLLIFMIHFVQIKTICQSVFSKITKNCRGVCTHSIFKINTIFRYKFTVNCLILMLYALFPPDNPTKSNENSKLIQNDFDQLFVLKE